MCFNLVNRCSKIQYIYICVTFRHSIHVRDVILSIYTNRSKNILKPITKHYLKNLLNLFENN